MSNNYTNEEEMDSQRKENKFVRFLITLLWLIISIGVDIIAIATESFIAGAAVELIFGIITFCIPYLRKKGSYTRWFGFLAFVSAVGLITANFNM